VNYP